MHGVNNYGIYYTYTCSDDNDEFVSINEYDTNGCDPCNCFEATIEVANVPNPNLFLIGGFYFGFEYAFDKDADGKIYLDDIQCLDLAFDAKQKDDGALWKKLDAKLPEKIAPHKYVAFIGFDSILFYVSDEMESILCLDLLITNKWYKSVKKWEDRRELYRVKVVITKNNDAHFMRYSDFENEQEAYHFKVSLWDLLPKELVMVYQNYYKILVYGYMRIYIDDIISIPNELKDIIAYYYPCFV